MFINYKWDKEYSSKSIELKNVSKELIFRYELEGTFSIGNDNKQIFTENFVPLYMLAKAFKESKFSDVEITVEGWGCNPFLTIKNLGSMVRVKNNFIYFECNQDDYNSQITQFISRVEKDIFRMGFSV